ncbi:homoserine O-succinyltransferase [Halomonas sp. BM-2019]|uniref:homoserine O-acetyltransferase/O-succinyltransferase family protein n=1 Tax=Halomonas sp. BM-2019 TaxID=2811227 RepID=UPI001B3C4A43|nr:MAG: homoserine O-succinyltransferase [Halomonas sp. BM-2019]
MPVLLHRPLPAIETLQAEGLDLRYAPKERGDIRIGFLNLMPDKITTERQWLRLFAQVDATIEFHFLFLNRWIPKTTPIEHIRRYYSPVSDLLKLDALVISGAPLGTKEYEEVGYWDELCEVFDYADDIAQTTLYLCWAANAAFFHDYNIPRKQKARKISGVYGHRIVRPHPLIEGIPNGVQFPHSRHAEARQHQLFAHNELQVLLHAPNAGAFLAVDELRRRAFLLGHPEYESDTLYNEFRRDFDKGLLPTPPEYYFVDEEASELPEPFWQEKGVRLLQNWLRNWIRK